MSDKTSEDERVNPTPPVTEIDSRAAMQELSLRKRLDELQRAVGSEMNENAANATFDLMRQAVKRTAKGQKLTGCEYAGLSLVESYNCLIGNLSFGTAEKFRLLAERSYNERAAKEGLPMIVPAPDPECPPVYKEPYLHGLLDEIHFPKGDERHEPV